MRRPPRHLMRKLVRLTRADWADLLEAQGALIRAQLLVWTRPHGRLIAMVTPAAEVAPASRGADTAALRLARAVHRAATYGLFRPLCLVRAVALSRLLERHGIPGGRVCIGVRRHGGRFGAHAWIELGGQVLGDSDEHVGAYAPLADVRLVHPS